MNADISLSNATLTINLTNNSGQGYVTLNSFTNTFDSPPIDSGNPPLVAPAVANGTTATLINVDGGSFIQHITYYPFEITIYITTKGTIYFNLPNAEILEINWNIDPNSPDENVIQFKTPGTYRLDGVNSPAINGNSYTYNVTLLPN